MEKKTVYKTPLTEIVQVRLNSPIQQVDINGSGYNDEQLGHENRGSFFDEDEADDGGYKKFQLWDSADNNCQAPQRGIEQYDGAW
jgi:hypothetical protein